MQIGKFLEIAKNKKRQKKNQNPSKDYYKKLLELYNVHIKVDSTLNETEWTSCLNKIDLIEIDEFRKQSKLIVFLLTKSYAKSELLEKHMNEAKVSKCEKIFLILENGVRFKQKNFKIFYLEDHFQKSRNVQSFNQDFVNEMNTLNKVSFLYFN